MRHETQWLELTSVTDAKIYVNFDHVVTITPSDDGKSTTLTTAGGKCNVKEGIEYFRAKLPI